LVDDRITDVQLGNLPLELADAQDHLVEFALDGVEPLIDPTRARAPNAPTLLSVGGFLGERTLALYVRAEAGKSLPWLDFSPIPRAMACREAALPSIR
jgi:hypothetical protein